MVYLKGLIQGKRYHGGDYLVEGVGVDVRHRCADISVHRVEVPDKIKLPQIMQK